MKTKELDVKVYNDLLLKASMYDSAKDEIKALIKANEALINYYSEHHFYKLANNLSLKNNGCKCALSTMKSVEDIEDYGEYVILSDEEYEGLVQTPGKQSLFMDSLENELRLKKDDIKVYEEIGDGDIANNLRHEYTGMLLVKDIFLKIMKA